MSHCASISSKNQAWVIGRNHVGTMITSCCRRHDGRAVLLAASEAGQSTPGQPDRDSGSIIGVDLATDTLEVGARGANTSASRRFAPLNSGMHGRYDHRGGCGLVKQRAWINPWSSCSVLVR